MVRQDLSSNGYRTLFASRLIVNNFTSKLTVTLMREGKTVVDSYEIDLDNMEYGTSSSNKFNRYFNTGLTVLPYYGRRLGDADAASNGNGKAPGILYPGEVYASRRPYNYTSYKNERVMQRRVNTGWQYTNDSADLSTPLPDSSKSEWIYDTDTITVTGTGTFDVSIVMCLDKPYPYRSWDGSDMSTVQLQIRDIPYDIDMSDLLVYEATSDWRYHYNKASDYKRNNFQFGVHIKLKDDLDSLRTLSERIDPRCPILEWGDVSDLFEITFFEPGLDVDLFALDSTDLFRHLSDANKGPENYRYDDFDDFLSSNRFVKLFDAPTFAPVSLDVFRSAYFVDMPAFSFGEPLEGDTGDTINAAFDRYFLTGITDEWTPQLVNQKPVTPLPNPNLAYPDFEDNSYTSAADLRAGLQRDEAAKNLVVIGSFNINSTSAEAWAAELGSQSFLNDDDTTTQPGVYIHMPHQPDIDESMLADALSDSDLAALSSSEFRNRAFTQTLRVLDLDDNGKPAAIRTLAEALVANIKDWTHTNQRPFLSVEEFINSGVLKDAITTSGINTIGGRELPPLSPLYLSQAKFMGLISNRVVVRGDTFIVRAYGDAVNEITGNVQATACLEALVQRIPEYIDDTQAADTQTAALNTENQQFGRRFQIVSYRWLNQSDI